MKWGFCNRFQTIFSRPFQDRSQSRLKIVSRPSLLDHRFSTVSKPFQENRVIAVLRPSLLDRLKKCRFKTFDSGPLKKNAVPRPSFLDRFKNRFKTDSNTTVSKGCRFTAVSKRFRYSLERPIQGRHFLGRFKTIPTRCQKTASRPFQYHRF